MEKIKRFIGFLSQIPNDKLLHSFYGTWIFIIGLSLFDKEIALYLVVFIAVFKEILDIRGTGFNIKDIICTILIPCYLYWLV